MPLTNDGAGKCLEGLIGTTTNSVTLYVGLHTAEPSEGTPSELSGTGYARLQVTSSEWTVTNNSASVNATQEWASAAGAAWGDPTHIGFWSAATGGDLLAWSTIPNVDPIVLGSRVYANIGDLSITIPLS